MATHNHGVDVMIERHDEVPELHARTSTGTDGTTECTIFPAHVSDEEATTTWVSAKEGSFVDVEEMR